MREIDRVDCMDAGLSVDGYLKKETKLNKMVNGLENIYFRHRKMMWYGLGLYGISQSQSP
jgi:hypothetical protein